MDSVKTSQTSINDIRERETETNTYHASMLHLFIVVFFHFLFNTSTC